jgi:hypothetical protein
MGTRVPPLSGYYVRGMDAELVIFVGLQASGKSTFFRERFAATHEHVSKDLFRNNRNRNRRQTRLIEAALESGRSVVVDNTNPAPSDRESLVEIAREFGAGIVGYYFESGVRECLARNARREGASQRPPRGRLKGPRPGHLRDGQEARGALPRGGLRRALLRAAERPRLRGPRVLKVPAGGSPGGGPGGGPRGTPRGMSGADAGDNTTAGENPITIRS